MPTCVHAYMHRYVRTYIRTYRCITTNKQVIHVPYLYARNSNATHRCSIVQIVSHMLGARHNFLLQFGLEFGESLFCTLAFFRRGYGQGRPPCPRASAPPYVAEDRLSASLSLSLSLSCGKLLVRGLLIMEALSQAGEFLLQLNLTHFLRRCFVVRAPQDASCFIPLILASLPLGLAA